MLGEWGVSVEDCDEVETATPEAHREGVEECGCRASSASASRLRDAKAGTMLALFRRAHISISR
jgi:hypothetical protein